MCIQEEGLLNGIAIFNLAKSYKMSHTYYLYFTLMHLNHYLGIPHDCGSRDGDNLTTFHPVFERDVLAYN